MFERLIFGIDPCCKGFEFEGKDGSEGEERVRFHGGLGGGR